MACEATASVVIAAKAQAGSIVGRYVIILILVDFGFVESGDKSHRKRDSIFAPAQTMVNYLKKRTSVKENGHFK
jgi:hypothetical protein